MTLPPSFIREELEKRHQIAPLPQIPAEIMEMAQRILDAPQPRELVFPNPHPQAQWFPKAGLGLFLHWGIHSVAGVEPSWSMIANFPEPGWGGELHPPHRYYENVGKFNPQHYDPSQWLEAAARAGFQYAVLTTKHCDGYALWPSALGEMNTRVYLSGRDLVRPYVEACRKHGLKVGLYYSPRDWAYPGFIDRPDFDHGAAGIPIRVTNPAKCRRDFTRFFAYVIGQLHELLTTYGRIDELWFDGMFWHGIADMKTLQVYQWLRALQPGMLVNQRWAGVVDPDDPAASQRTFPGDFVTPEGGLPKSRPQSWWENCIPTQQHWGYDPSEQMMPLEKIVARLVACRQWGGNLLLNVGPRPDGTMPDIFYRYCERLGQWMSHSRESLIGTNGGPLDLAANVPVTTRDNTWYLHLLAGAAGEIEIRSIPRPVRCTLLRTRETLEHSWAAGVLRIRVAAEKRTDLDDVVSLTLT